MKASSAFGSLKKTCRKNSNKYIAPTIIGERFFNPSGTILSHTRRPSERLPEAMEALGPSGLTDRLQIHTLAGLDDELVMDVAADKAVAQRPHGVTQDVPADCLYNVFHEFRAVTFDSLPFFVAPTPS